MAIIFLTVFFSLLGLSLWASRAGRFGLSAGIFLITIFAVHCIKDNCDETHRSPGQSVDMCVQENYQPILQSAVTRVRDAVMKSDLPCSVRLLVCQVHGRECPCDNRNSTLLERVNVSRAGLQYYCEGWESNCTRTDAIR
jgi:hypothetical protein